MTFFEHLLLFDWPLISILCVILLFGLPAPIRQWSAPGRPLWLRSTLVTLHGMAVFIGLVLWVRWLFGVDLADRADATFAVLLLLPSLVVLLRTPLIKRRTLMDHITERAMGLCLHRRPRARRMLDLAHVISGQKLPESEDPMALRGRTVEQRLPTWASRSARRLGWIQRKIRMLPSRGVGPLHRALLRQLIRAERALAQALLSARGAGSDRRTGQIETLIDRIVAFSEYTARIAPRGWASLRTRDADHAAGAVLGAVTVLARADAAQPDALCIEDLMRSLRAILGAGRAPVDAIWPPDATLPSTEWLVRVLDLTCDPIAGGEKLRGLQRLRQKPIANQTAARPVEVEDLARFFLSHRLLAPGRKDAVRYVGWALEVALGEPKDGREDSTGNLPTALAWIREQAVGVLQLPADSPLKGERFVLAGMHTESMIRARDPRLWRPSATARRRH